MKPIAPSLALLLLFNTAIAALLTVIEFGEGFWINLLFSQCIGFSIGMVNSPLILRVPSGWLRLATLAAGLPFSVMSASCWPMSCWETPSRYRIRSGKRSPSACCSR
jgi:hypothetical protein